MTNQELTNLLSLNEEQTALLEELKSVLSRMGDAGMEIVYDEEGNDFSVINAKNVEIIVDDNIYDDDIDLDEYTELDDDCLPWRNVYLVDKRYNSEFNKLYYKKV